MYARKGSLPLSSLTEDAWPPALSPARLGPSLLSPSTPSAPGSGQQQATVQRSCGSTGEVDSCGEEPRLWAEGISPEAHREHRQEAVSAGLDCQVTGRVTLCPLKPLPAAPQPTSSAWCSTLRMRQTEGLAGFVEAAAEACFPQRKRPPGANCHRPASQLLITQQQL